MSIAVPTVPPANIRRQRVAGASDRTRGRAANVVPENFSDLYERYYRYVVRLVQSKGIDAEAAEDVAQAILLHFFRHDALSDFDPERQIKFTTFLSGFVIVYLRHHLVMQSKQAQRQPVSIDALISTEDQDDADRSWLNVKGPRAEFDAADLEYLDAVSTLRGRLLDLGPTTAQDRCDMPSFFDAVRRQIEQTGGYDTRALAEQFGVATSTVQHWIKRLRAALR